MEYRITYEIDIEAETPLGAALEAERIMGGDPESGYRPVLTVSWVPRDNPGAIISEEIDLDELEE